MTLESMGNAAGFLGAVTILLGFGWSTLRNAAPDMPYHLANFFGAVLLAASLWINFNLPALCLELAWALIALVGLIRALGNKGQSA